MTKLLTINSEPESADTGTQGGKDAEEKEPKMCENVYTSATLMGIAYVVVGFQNILGQFAWGVHNIRAECEVDTEYIFYCKLCICIYNTIRHSLRKWLLFCSFLTLYLY